MSFFGKLGKPGGYSPNLHMVANGIGMMGGANSNSALLQMGQQAAQMRAQKAKQQQFQQMLQDPKNAGMLPKSVMGLAQFMDPATVAKLSMHHKLSQARGGGEKVMNVGGNLVRVRPGEKPEVLYSPPTDTIDQKLKAARLAQIQKGDPLKQLKTKLLKDLMGGNGKQTADPNVRLQSNTVEEQDPNLIKTQTASGEQEPSALGNLTPEQKRAMALNLVSPGLGNTILQNQKAQNFQKPAQNKLETNILNSEEGYARLQSIRKQFKPEYQQFMGKGKAAWYSLKDKFGGLSSEEKGYLRDFSQYRQSAAQNLNLYIKEITGAQMSEAEAQRLSKGVPVAGNGIFDGDSPTEFRAKADQTMQDLALARMRYHYLKNQGWRGTVMSPEDIAAAAKKGRLPITLPQMRGIFNNRVRDLQKSGIDRRQSIAQAKQEFGI